MATLWVNLEVNLATKLKGLADTAGLSETEILKIHEVSTVPLERLATFGFDQLKALGLIVQAQVLESERADRNEKLLAAKALTAAEDANGEMRRGFMELRRGLTALTTVIDTTNFINNLTKYSGREKPGKTDRFMEWLRQIDRLGALKGLNDTAMKELCTSTLVHDAADYCARLITENEDIEWKDLRTLLCKRYSSYATGFTARHTLRCIKQGANESIQSLAERIMLLADSAYTPHERKDEFFETELIDTLAQAVTDPRTLRAFIDKRPATFDEGVKLALSIQNSQLIYQMVSRSPFDRRSDRVESRIEQPMEVNAMRKVAENATMISKEQTSLLNGLMLGQKQTSMALKQLAYQLQALRQNKARAVLKKLNSQLLVVNSVRPKETQDLTDDEEKEEGRWRYHNSARRGATSQQGLEIERSPGYKWRWNKWPDRLDRAKRKRPSRPTAKGGTKISRRPSSSDSEWSISSKQSLPFDDFSVESSEAESGGVPPIIQEDFDKNRCFHCHMVGHRRAECSSWFAEASVGMKDGGLSGLN
jgi:hypothetical protein